MLAHALDITPNCQTLVREKCISEPRTVVVALWKYRLSDPHALRPRKPREKHTSLFLSSLDDQASRSTSALHLCGEQLRPRPVPVEPLEKSCYGIISASSWVVSRSAKVAWLFLTGPGSKCSDLPTSQAFHPDDFFLDLISLLRTWGRSHGDTCWRLTRIF